MEVCILTGVVHITAIHSHRSDAESEIKFHMIDSQIIRVWPVALMNSTLLRCINNAISLQQGFPQLEWIYPALIARERELLLLSLTL